MIRETFAERSSVVHILDPRCRIIFAVVYSVIVALSQSFPALIAALIASIFMVVLSRPDPVDLLKRLAVVNGLIAFIWLITPWTFPGVPLVMIGPLSASREGVLFCLRLTLKSNAVILAFIAMVATIPVAVLGQTLGVLRVPPKLVYLFTFTYRYLFVIEQEYRRLVRSLKVRGFQPKTNLHTYQTYAYLIGMLLVRAMRRAERVHQAMKCRGFKNQFYTLQMFVFTNTDRLAVALAVPTLIILVYLEWMFR